MSLFCWRACKNQTQQMCDCEAMKAMKAMKARCFGILDFWQVSSQ